MIEDFTTNELALAAFLKASGHEPNLIPPPDPAGYCRFQFEGNPNHFQDLARNFANGASTPALAYYNALNGLRAQIRNVRSARGGWR